MMLHIAVTEAEHRFELINFSVSIVSILEKIQCALEKSYCNLLQKHRFRSPETSSCNRILSHDIIMKRVQFGEYGLYKMLLFIFGSLGDFLTQCTSAQTFFFQRTHKRHSIAP